MSFLLVISLGYHQHGVTWSWPNWYLIAFYFQVHPKYDLSSVVWVCKEWECVWWYGIFDEVKRQVVVHEGNIREKPLNAEEARHFIEGRGLSEVAPPLHVTSVSVLWWYVFSCTFVGVTVLLSHMLLGLLVSLWHDFQAALKTDLVL